MTGRLSKNTKLQTPNTNKLPQIPTTEPWRTVLRFYAHARPSWSRRLGFVGVCVSDFGVFLVSLRVCSGWRWALDSAGMEQLERPPVADAEIRRRIQELIELKGGGANPDLVEV